MGEGMITVPGKYVCNNGCIVWITKDHIWPSETNGIKLWEGSIYMDQRPDVAIRMNGTHAIWNSEGRHVNRADYQPIVNTEWDLIRPYEEPVHNLIKRLLEWADGKEA